MFRKYAFSIAILFFVSFTLPLQVLAQDNAGAASMKAPELLTATADTGAANTATATAGAEKGAAGASSRGAGYTAGFTAGTIATGAAIAAAAAAAVGATGWGAPVNQ